jgi:hypothetical protein
MEPVYKEQQSSKPQKESQEYSFVGPSWLPQGCWLSRSYVRKLVFVLVQQSLLFELFLLHNKCYIFIINEEASFFTPPMRYSATRLSLNQCTKSGTKQPLALTYYSDCVFEPFVYSTINFT